MKSLRKVFPLVGILIVTLLFALPAAAQTTTGRVELVGAIEAMTLDTVTVNAQEIDISGAEINTPVEVDAIVKVEGTLNTDGSISAMEVNPAPAGMLIGEAELIGNLEVYNGTSMLINGQIVDVSTAEIEAGIVVGELVKVHASSTGPNMWTAREAAPFDGVLPVIGSDSSGILLTDEDFEIVGTLQAVNGDSIVVSGQSIDIATAELHDPLVQGVLVKVHVRLVDGMLVASEVENVDSSDNANDNSNDNDDEGENDNENGNVNDNDDDDSNDNSDGQRAAAVELTAQEAIARALEVFPNATVLELELEDKYGTTVWEIKLNNGREFNIDAQSGVILTIESEDGSSSGNSGSNSNDNDDDDGNDNDDDDSNDNDDDHDNDNDDDHDDDHDNDNDDDHEDEEDEEDESDDD